MHKELTIIGRLIEHAPAIKVLASALGLALSMAVSASAQNGDAPWSAISVDESFSAFHQALSETANDLLARAQRPSAAPHPIAEVPADLTPTLAPAVSGSSKQAEAQIRLQRALKRVQALRPTLEPVLREEGIPREMAAIVLIESGGQTTALSSKGARGLWQIMPNTARRYGLLVTEAVDERLDPYKSTRAAARYLHDLYVQFGDWPLALAAYNAGEDVVERAVKRGSRRDFAFLAGAGLLPLETRNYVPAVLGAITLMNGASGRYVTTRAARSAFAAVVYALSEAQKLEVYE